MLDGPDRIGVSNLSHPADDAQITASIADAWVSSYFRLGLSKAADRFDPVQEIISRFLDLSVEEGVPNIRLPIDCGLYLLSDLHQLRVAVVPPALCERLAVYWASLNLVEPLHL